MNVKTFIMTCGLAVCLLAQPAMAGPLEDGLTAFGKGDYATALKLWRPLAGQGDATAQSYLGDMYDDGVGVPEDDAEAVKWYRKAADQGDAPAQSNLGVMYDNGRGVAQDYAEAVKWYRKAADQGNADTQYNIGVMYQNGYGVKRDYVQAYMWYNLSAASSLAAGDNKESYDVNLKTSNFAIKKMTPAQIAEAQRLAREWTAEHPK